MMMSNPNEDGKCFTTDFSCQKECTVNDFCDFRLKVAGAKFTGDDGSKQCTTSLMSQTKHPTHDKCMRAGKEKRSEEFKCTYFPKMAAKTEWCQVGQSAADIGNIHNFALLASVFPLLCGFGLCGWAAMSFMQKDKVPRSMASRILANPEIGAKLQEEVSVAQPSA
mmetsp:Transcript_61409/g.170270  ORF Transcript_61409/g.170270 Transcript_61409/m.170270 type:complete len:166 (+) Transcript_61409:159-656(+)